MNLENIKGSNTFRVFFIGFLILLLLIPMGMVEDVINQRGHLYRQANNEITASWGKEQIIAGPILSLPYLKSVLEDGIWSYVSRYEHIRPGLMRINTSIDTEVRYRGIYKVTVYTATVIIQGVFSLSQAGIEVANTSEFDFDEGFVQIPLTNRRSIKEPVRFVWDDEEIILHPRVNDQTNESVILAAQIPPDLLDKNTDHSFSLELKLAGSSEIGFISSSQDTNINVDANWASPGFFGIYLPLRYTITDEDFTASWEINDLLSNMGHGGTEIIPYKWYESQPRFGVRLVQPVDTYRLVTRAAKYAVLFISLTFLVYFFTEIVGKVSLHTVQYLLVGGANCIFYLLLLSLAEHIRFNLAYFISSCASVSLIALYSVSILKSRTKALVMFILLSGLYTYLFVTLRSEAYALLIGSIGLFVILGLAMYLTRNVDWNRAVSVVKSD